MSETRAEYHAGEQTPELEPAISRIFQFSDGTRLKVIVEAWPNKIGLSHKAYYNELFFCLRRIEQGEKPDD